MVGEGERVFNSDCDKGSLPSSLQNQAREWVWYAPWPRGDVRLEGDWPRLRPKAECG